MSASLMMTYFLSFLVINTRHNVMNCMVRKSLYLCSANDTDDEFAASGSGWDSLSIRHAFIRKVKTHLSHTERHADCVSCE